MTAVLDAQLGPAVLGHLDAQLESARRLLGTVLAQGQAIRAQDVEAVLVRLSEVQEEMDRRGGLERDRSALLAHAGDALGIPAHAVTLEALTSLMTDHDADAARDRSAELRGLLAEIGREHGINRALMRQELAFLDHLTRLISGGDERPGYGLPAVGPGAAPPTLEPHAAALRVLDLRA